MLDRLSLGFVSLPPSTYDTIFILSDADRTRTESSALLNRNVIGLLSASLKPGGTIKSQDGTFASKQRVTERTEAILAGLVVDENIEDENGGARKPQSTSASIPLRFGKSKAEGGAAATTTAVGTGAASDALNTNGKRLNGDTNGHALASAAPAGVGFVDFSDDLDAPVELDGDDDDDELIDEDTLLTEEDLVRPIQQRKLRLNISQLHFNTLLCHNYPLPNPVTSL